MGVKIDNRLVMASESHDADAGSRSDFTSNLTKPGIRSSLSRVTCGGRA
jgi:hypothetical protein